jgi:hypothetical protein
VSKYSLYSQEGITPLDIYLCRDRRQPATASSLVSSLASLLVRIEGKCCYVLNGSREVYVTNFAHYLPEIDNICLFLTLIARKNFNNFSLDLFQMRGATSTTTLPWLAPRNSPRRAYGARSRPYSDLSSRVFTVPFLIHFPSFSPASP